MSEHQPADLQRQSAEKTHHWLRDAACIGSIAVAGGVAGAYIGAQTPTEVQFAPGVSADVSAQHGGSTINLGITKLHLPEATKAGFGANIDIKPITVVPGEDGVQQTYTQLFARGDSTIVEPVRDAIAMRALAYGSAGALIAGGLALWRRRRPEQTSFFSARSLTAAGLAALTLSVPSAQKAFNSPAPAETTYAPLDPSLTAHNPLLKDAYVEGSGGEAINEGARFIINHIAQAKNTWVTARQNFYKEISAFRASGGMDYLDQSHITPILHVSDLHCNSAYYQEMLPALLDTMQPNIVVNTGDTYLHNNTMAYEANCATDLVKALQAADIADLTMINVQGNHDPEQPPDEMQKPFIVTLGGGNSNETTVHSITFIGESDPTRTTIGPTQPESPAQQASLIQQQGERIADQACNATQRDETAPIVLAHQREALLESIQRNCATAALSGHVHDPLRPVVAFRGYKGKTAIEHTAGSASGADGPMTMYSAPSIQAVAVLHLYNRASGTIDGSIAIRINPDSTVQIENLPALAA